jgi:hypothetical protein
MKNTIWTLEYDGCDDGSTVVGVFTTKEKAKLFNKTFALNCDIHEYELNPHSEDIESGMIPWIFNLDVDGKVSQIEKSLCFKESIEPKINDKFYFFCNIVASTKSDAIKIANQKRMELLKNGNWKNPILEYIDSMEKYYLWRSEKSNLGSSGSGTAPFFKEVNDLREYFNKLSVYVDNLISQ